MGLSDWDKVILSQNLSLSSEKKVPLPMKKSTISSAHFVFLLSQGSQYDVSAEMLLLLHRGAL